MSGKVIDNTAAALNTSLNLRLMNNNVITSNIANSDTPGYKAKRLEFETALKNSLEVGDDLRMNVSDQGHQLMKDTDPVHPEIYEDPNYVETLDGNTVNRGEEMARLQENQLLYESSVELLKKKLGMMRYGITEGGGGGR